MPTCRVDQYVERDDFFAQFLWAFVNFAANIICKLKNTVSGEAVINLPEIKELIVANGVELTNSLIHIKPSRF